VSSAPYSVAARHSAPSRNHLNGPAATETPQRTRQAPQYGTTLFVYSPQRPTILASVWKYRQTAFRGSQSHERLLDPSIPCTTTFQEGTRQVSRDIGIFSTPTNVHSYSSISNVTDLHMDDEPLSLGAGVPSLQSNASPPLADFGVSICWATADHKPISNYQHLFPRLATEYCFASE
jgi:hypothetical protein